MPGSCLVGDWLVFSSSPIAKLPLLDPGGGLVEQFSPLVPLLSCLAVSERLEAYKYLRKIGLTEWQG